ncbi:hypothetical protein K469DRAFT_267913 [Zopfia rhizophila CBS 207.26]|uniref:Heterokaryon incompatibility domain-containing protein n=1 Tax=Zopfia rhizophila CBS 207.26 TaxID=1314779 RepID=A0A6A6DNB1_9PEZI|nr:hypothetical protein K469DRAFT_267913 [Zopfia rhizophila CBS 207.26]
MTPHVLRHTSAGILLWDVCCADCTSARIIFKSDLGLGAVIRHGRRVSSVETSFDTAIPTHFKMQSNVQRYLLCDVEPYHRAAPECRYPPLSLPLSDGTT